VELNGYDSVLFTITPPAMVLAAVIASVRSCWPAALVVDWDGPADGEPLAAFSLDRLAEKWTQLQFYRDVAMLRHMEAIPYEPMADGDGPFAVLTRVRRDVEFAISGLKELHAADHTPDGSQPPDPYPARLYAPKLTEVSAVTPGDPDSLPFASWVLTEVKRACRGAG